MRIHLPKRQQRIPIWPFAVVLTIIGVLYGIGALNFSGGSSSTAIEALSIESQPNPSDSTTNPLLSTIAEDEKTDGSPTTKFFKPPKVAIPAKPSLRLPPPDEVLSTSDPMMLTAYVVVETASRLHELSAPVTPQLTNGDDSILKEWDTYVMNYGQGGGMGVPDRTYFKGQQPRSGMEISWGVLPEEGFYIEATSVPVELYWVKADLYQLVYAYMKFLWNFKEGEWKLTTIRPEA